jgi:hypothetical protein
MPPAVPIFFIEVWSPGYFESWFVDIMSLYLRDQKAFNLTFSKSGGHIRLNSQCPTPIQTGTLPD